MAKEQEKERRSGGESKSRSRSVYVVRGILLVLFNLILYSLLLIAIVWVCMHPQLAVNAGEATLNLLVPTAKRCPHLGCALKWNPTERTWDCPCHGSRFTEDGKLIDNPATGDFKER